NMSERRNNKRFRGEGSGYSKKERNPSTARHPPHLKGREIGLYYRNLKRPNKTNPPPLFKCNSLENLNISEDDPYAYIDDSPFKRKFLSIISGSITDKLENTESAIMQLPMLDEQFLREHTSKADNIKYKAMLKQRLRLPAFEKREELIKIIEENQVVVISGETGCGKTTQVTQFILDHYIENRKGSTCKIVCTQPRRISAISVAERVAEERGETLGNSVGYQIRLEKKLPRLQGCICYCTTGVVLRQMETDPCLTGVSHIILDEIHERNVISDFLITLLKQVLENRSDLKVILMSATLNSDAFSEYYNGCPHINIPGFTFPVTQYFLEDALQQTKHVLQIREAPGRNASRGAWKKYRDRKLMNKTRSEFEDYIVPYVRQLSKEGKYDESVCQQVRSPDSENISLFLIKDLIIYICENTRDDGAILVFLPGLAHIGTLYKLLQQCGKFPERKYILIPLHSLMPTVEQKAIFKPPPTGMRKIIISTNIAETSITIDDVVYVIDCGKIKITNFDVATNNQTLNEELVSIANADQRKGRAGRVKPGVCYHLFTKARYHILEKYQLPEILRVRPDNTILQAKILQLGKVQPFFEKLMDPPNPEVVSLSLNLLRRIYALDADENLTPLGYHLAKLSVAPQLGKMIILGAIFSCLNPILSVAASLDFKDAFQIPLGKEKQADMMKVELAGDWKSDHLLLHKALEAFETSSNPSQFCWKYFLSSYTLKLLQKMKRDFMGQLLDLNFVSDLDPKNEVNNRNSNNLSLVKAIICAGLYPNVATISCKQTVRKTIVAIRPMGNTKRSKLHMKSVLSDVNTFDAPLLVYWQKLKTTCDFIHDASTVHALPVIFFGDQFKCMMQDGNHVISVGDALTFKVDESTAKVIAQLRDRLNWFLGYKISHPGVVDWDEDSNEIDVLRAIMELITNEEIGEVFPEMDNGGDDDSDDSVFWTDVGCT
ncbi:hypothetical protein NQ315_001968, partial [Exocentrus adspersus]